jgi:uncharacterized protein (TIGR00251 family)
MSGRAVIRIAVRVVPKSSRSRILGAAPEAGGETSLKVAVAAVPEDGKANAELIEVLASAFAVARRDVSVVAGAASRRKFVEISGDGALLTRRLQELLSGGRRMPTEASAR